MGYYGDFFTYYDTAPTCNYFDGWDCKACSSGYISETDVEGIYVSSGYEYCNKNCPSETYLKLDYNDPKNVNTVTATTCGSCHSGVDGCKRCVGPGSDECLVCNVGYYLDRGSIDTQLHGTCVAKSGSASGEWFLTATAYTGYKDGSSTYPFDQLAEALEAISSAAAPYESYTAVLQVEGGNHWELPYMKTRTLF